ncbi:regulator of G-protein signaling 10 isoform 1-T1 [Acridotheres tristis]
MEEPASTLCLTTCYIKHCKPLGITANPPGLGQPLLSRSCSCSRRIMKQKWSNSASKCALPIIPEYPGFQDVKLSRSYLGNSAFKQIFQDLERGKNSSPQLSNFPRRGSLPLCLGHSSGGCLKGHQTCSPGFQDKPVQEYFNERLKELGSHDRSSRRTKGFAEKSQSPFLALRGPWHRSSCSSVLLVAHGKEGEQPCSPAQQHSKRRIQCQAQKDIQNVLKLYTGDLDLLTMHITAPLEVFVQKK